MGVRVLDSCREAVSRVLSFRDRKRNRNRQHSITPSWCEEDFARTEGRGRFRLWSFNSIQDRYWFWKRAQTPYRAGADGDGSDDDLVSDLVSRAMADEEDHRYGRLSSSRVRRFKQRFFGYPPSNASVTCSDID